jgi:hypothetical protein
MQITWPQALAWRMGQQLLEPVGTESVTAVVRRLGAVLAMDPAGAELAVRQRRTDSEAGELARAVEDGSVVLVFAFRGAVHHVSPEDGGAYLALRAAGRQWERRSWREFYRLEPDDWPSFRAAVRDALADGPLTVAELGAAVTQAARYRHLRPVFDEGAGTLLKPLSWQGDLSLGLPRDGRPTYRRMDDNPRWAGVWDLEKAGPYAIAEYVRAYGPTTPEHVHRWLGGGLSAGAGRLRAWLGALGDRLTPVDVDGRSTLVLTEDVDALMAARPTHAVRLLPGHDQWVMGPGTDDEQVVPRARRDPVTRKANLVTVGGVVAGTWVAGPSVLRVTWFGENGTPPLSTLEQEAARLAGLLGRPLETAVDVV